MWSDNDTRQLQLEKLNWHCICRGSRLHELFITVDHVSFYCERDHFLVFLDNWHEKMSIQLSCASLANHSSSIFNGFFCSKRKHSRYFILLFFFYSSLLFYLDFFDFFLSFFNLFLTLFFVHFLLLFTMVPLCFSFYCFFFSPILCVCVPNSFSIVWHAILCRDHKFNSSQLVTGQFGCMVSFDILCKINHVYIWIIANQNWLETIWLVLANLCKMVFALCLFW